MPELLPKRRLVDRLGDKIIYGKWRAQVVALIVLFLIAFGVHQLSYWPLKDTKWQILIPAVLPVFVTTVVLWFFCLFVRRYVGGMLLRHTDARSLQMLRWRELELLVHELYRLRGFRAFRGRLMQCGPPLRFVAARDVCLGMDAPRASIRRRVCLVRPRMEV